MIELRKIIVVLTVTVCAITGFPATAVSDLPNKPIIVIVQSRNTAPYNDVISGFKKELKSAERKVRYYEFDLNQVKEKGMVEKIKKVNPDLILAVGAPSANYLKNSISHIPILFMMVLNPVQSGVINSFEEPGTNITGVTLNIKTEIHFRKMKELLPSVRKVGMLYNVSNPGLVKNAEEIAPQYGLEIIAKPINSRSDVKRALDELAYEADCLWADVDTFVFNLDSIKQIILLTLKNKTPFITFSPTFVRAGALFALECDYHDVGKQTGELANSLLNGISIDSIPVAYPRNINVIVNQRTAELIDVDIPQSILLEAEEVFRIK